MTTQTHSTEKKVRLFDSPVVQERVKHHAENAFRDFFSLTHATKQFNLAFFALAATELVAILLLSALSKSLFIAICLAGLCLTVFSYFLLSFYMEAKKPEQMEEISSRYLSSCKEAAGEGADDDSIFLAYALRYFSDLLEMKKWIAQSPAPLPFLQPLFEKCLVWMHWKEIHQMRELLLSNAIEHHLDLIRKEPLDLEAHAALSHTYLTMANLQRADQSWPWTPSAYSSKPMKEKFESYTARAVQEFKILDALAPNEPWVHAQLASIYHDLEMAQKEIEEYEILLKLSPQDHKLIFRLGVLYFKQGETARALLLYEQLKKANDPRADDLIAHY
ncbi:MAG: hypothetical protein HYX48_00095 [Chlamydiales bacterium]|nr:hypothetical protein [Chlamydiales bacterium]